MTQSFNPLEIPILAIILEQKVTHDSRLQPTGDSILAIILEQNHVDQNPQELHEAIHDSRLQPTGDFHLGNYLGAKPCRPKPSRTA